MKCVKIEDEDIMESEKLKMKIDYCDPTIMFTWQGTRKKSQKEQHSHDFLEMVFVLSGTGKYSVEEEIIEVEAGDLLIFNPGVMHRCVVTEGCEQFATEFLVGFSDMKLQEYPKNFIPLPRKGNLMHTEGDLKQKLSKICLTMSAENEIWQVGRYFMLKAYLIQMLMMVIRERSEISRGPVERYAFESVNKKHVVDRIVGYFEEHYSEKISLDQIAGDMFLSTFYISKIFKSELGEAPITYLINVRLEKAKELLTNEPDLSVQIVASRVGYSDAYYFSRHFKKKYGVSPTQLKREEQY